MIPFIRAALAANTTVPVTPAGEAGTAVEASGIVPTCATQPGGAQTLDCVLQMFINIADILLGVVGAVALAIIVWGGVLYLTSHGNSAQVTKANKMLLSAGVGLLFVFGAFSGVQYGVNVIRGGNGNSNISGEFFTCVDAVGEPANEGQACAAGFVCNAGACCDTLDLDGKCPAPQ